MITPLWTATEIAMATGGTVHGDFSVNGVSIDSRSVEAGPRYVYPLPVTPYSRYTAFTSLTSFVNELFASPKSMLVFSS